MLRTTPLNDWHRQHGARFAEFAGWSMPIQYEAGAIAEHRMVRDSAGLFDVSHMGRFFVTGPGSAKFLNHLISSNVAGLSVNESTYGLLCREDGGVLDDVFVYRLPDEWMVVVNAANLEKDMEWMSAHVAGRQVTLEDRSAELCMIAFQGPAVLPLLKPITNIDAAADITALPRFNAAVAEIAGVNCIAGRTGYTGEDGVEMFVASDRAEELWAALLAAAEKAGVACGPVGLAARDSLRFEPGFALYGHELTEKISPVQARLKWACDLESDFIGAEAIRRQAEEGVATKLATVRLTEKGVPRQGHRVLYEGRDVGFVASGMYAPTVDAYCANVFVESKLARTGTGLEIEIRNRKKAAEVVKRPLYRPAYRE